MLRISLGKGTVLIGVALAVIALGSREKRRSAEGPKYDGRSLSTWVNFIESRWSCRADRSSPFFLQTSNAIVQIGTNGLPHLLKWIQYEPSPLLLVSAEAIDEVDHLLPSWEVFDFIAEWFRRGFDRAESAAVALEILGESAAGLAPELKMAALEGESRWTARRAMYVLPPLGPAALPVLLELASSTNAVVRYEAIRGLGRVTSDGDSAIPLLLERLEDPDSNCARAAVCSLGDLRLQPGSIIPALIDKLRSPDQAIRTAAAFSLADFGTNAWQALPAIRTASIDGYCLTNAIERIAPIAPSETLAAFASPE